MCTRMPLLFLMFIYADHCRPGPYTSLDILKQPPLDPNQALVVGARSHENGYVGYIGGNSSRDQFVDILLAFFGTGF